MSARLFFVLRCLAFGLCLCAAGGALAAQQLVVSFMISSGQQRTAWFDLVTRFAAENPDIEVTNREFAQEEYKRGFLRRIEAEPIDIAFWFAGTRLRDAVGRGLLRPLDPATVAVLQETGFARGTLEEQRIDGRLYGFPVSYYGWGFFYRKSLFAEHGIVPPKTWEEFLAVCAKLKAVNITPLAVGARDGWPAAGWFDYLNLRLNGIRFHRRLLDGQESFADPRVRKVFEAWRELLARDYFLAEAMDTDWEGVLPYLYRGRAGMVLMGGFAAAKFPAAVAADIGFFPFPTMRPGMPRYEEAPLDVLVLPASGRNSAAAQRFLAYAARSNGLAAVNRVRHTLSPQMAHAPRSGPGADEAAILHGAAGLTFFFDRDARVELVKPALEGFRLFLAPPHDIDAAIRHITQRPAQKP